MPRADRPAIERILVDLLDAEKDVRRLRAALVISPADILADAIEGSIAAAGATADEEERACHLISLAITLGRLPGPRAVEALMTILGSEEPEARHAAGSALQEHAFERFKEVAVGVEHALESLPPGSLALSELPYLLVEVPEPGVAKLLGRFLQHRDADAVAAAIEAAVELGDEGLLRPLQALIKDTRLVEVDDEESDDEDAGGQITLGELASEAVQILSSQQGEDDE